MSMLGANQPCVQRANSLTTMRTAKWSAVIGGLFLWVFTFLSALVGMVIFAYYTNIGCDPVQVIANKYHSRRGLPL